MMIFFYPSKQIFMRIFTGNISSKATTQKLLCRSCKCVPYVITEMSHKVQDAKHFWHCHSDSVSVPCWQTRNKCHTYGDKNPSPMLSARVHTPNTQRCYCVCRVIEITHVNNQAGGAPLQQLSLSFVMCNDRAGGAGCVGLHMVTSSCKGHHHTWTNC